jgi:hypothetical protein
MLLMAVSSGKLVIILDIMYHEYDLKVCEYGTLTASVV